MNVPVILANLSVLLSEMQGDLLGARAEIAQLRDEREQMLKRITELEGGKGGQ